jgi:photosystem II stability/assembly factor-like uncharacterized protein
METDQPAAVIILYAGTIGGFGWRQLMILRAGKRASLTSCGAHGVSAWIRVASFALGLATLLPLKTAQANNAVQLALDHPSQLTAGGKDGLLTAVARAGHRLAAVGERGRILLSDDNGASWRQVETPTSVTLTQISFATPHSGWAVGQMGVVLHTQDGGLTWQKQFDGLAANQELMRAAQAEVKAEPGSAPAAANLQAAQQFVGGGPSVPFLDILPLSPANLLLAGGYGMAFSSRDGGQSWQSIFESIPNPNGFHIYGLVHNATDVYVIGEQGLLLRRDANGYFTTLTPPFQGSFFGGLTGSDGSLIVFGLQGTILRSTDQGKDWAQPVSNVTAGIDCGLLLHDGRIILGDVAGDLLVSDDNARSFSTIPAGEPVTSLAEAPDGGIIIAGLFGLRRVSPNHLNPGA